MSVPKLRFPEFRDGEGWGETSLGKAAKNLDNRRVPISESDRSKGNIPYYGASGIVDFVKDFIFDEDLLCVSEDGANLVARTYPIAFSISGKTWVNNHAHVLKFEHKFTQIIIENYLNSISLEDFLTGMAQPKLNKAMLDKIPIFLPKKHLEQQKIAACLSSLDDVIRLESKKLDALKTHKTGLMQQLFPSKGESVPRIRFEGFEGDWEERKLIDVADKKAKWSFIGGPFGSNLKSSDYTEKGVRIIQLQNIGDGEFHDKYKIYTSDQKANELLSCNIYAGDIILSKMGDPVARACFVPNIESRYVMCSDGIRLVVNQSLFDKYYIFSYINFQTFRKLAEKNSTGSTRKRIGLDELKSLAVFAPSLPEQQKIATCLSSLDDLITAQTAFITTLKQQKKGLMQQLFPSMDEAVT